MASQQLITPRRYRLTSLLSSILIATTVFSGTSLADEVSNSDPIKLGIMQGFPPAPEKVVGPQNSLKFPFIRWSLRNARLISATANIEHSVTPLKLEQGKKVTLDNIKITVDKEQLSLNDYL